MRVLSWELLEQVVETDAVDEHGLVDPVDVLRVDALGKQRVSIDIHLLQGCILNWLVEMLLIAVLHQDLIQPILYRPAIQSTLPVILTLHLMIFWPCHLSLLYPPCVLLQLKLHVLVWLVLHAFFQFMLLSLHPIVLYFVSS